MNAKTQYSTATSLDGFIAGPGHSLDWLLQFEDADMSGMEAFIAEVGALAMGSHTYEWILRHALGPEAEDPQPWPYGQPAWIFSSRELPKVPDADIRFVEGDVTSVHQEMTKVANGRNLWIVGGGDLAGQFHDAGLLDEIIVEVVPVTLGKGYPLFPRRMTDPPLKLLSATPRGPGFVTLHYETGSRGGSVDGKDEGRS